MILTVVVYTIALSLNVANLAVFCTFSYVTFFSFSLGPLPFVILTEIFQTQALGLASSVALPINWMASFVVGQVFPLMSSGLGSYSFLPFAGYLVIALVIVLVFIPETKGKTLAAIWGDLGLIQDEVPVI
jgi:hypothetical protein